MELIMTDYFKDDTIICKGYELKFTELEGKIKVIDNRHAYVKFAEDKQGNLYKVWCYMQLNYDYLRAEFWEQNNDIANFLRENAKDEEDIMRVFSETWRMPNYDELFEWDKPQFRFIKFKT